VKLALATANEGKVREFREALGLSVVSARELGVTDFPEETGGSYEANAHAKALFVTQRTGLPSLGDDSGLEVDALSGAPGLHSARFGGKETDAARLAYLLEQLGGVPDEARTARFVCALVLTLPTGEVQSFEGRCEGRILRAPRGASGFGYDPVFYSADLHKTFAEASPEEKAGVSHRGRALQQFAAWARTAPFE